MRAVRRARIEEAGVRAEDGDEIAGVLSDEAGSFLARAHRVAGPYQMLVLPVDDRADPGGVNDDTRKTQTGNQRPGLRLERIAEHRAPRPPGADEQDRPPDQPLDSPVRGLFDPHAAKKTPPNPPPPHT